MSALLAIFQHWARKRGLAPFRHEAEFHGQLEGVGCQIETGIRPERRYVVRVVLDVATGLRGRVLRADTSIEAMSEPIVIAVVETLRCCPSALSVRLDEQATLRLKPGRTPDEVEEIVDSLAPIYECRGSPIPYR